MLLLPLFYCGYKARMSEKDAGTKKRNCGIKSCQFRFLFSVAVQAGIEPATK